MNEDIVQLCRMASRLGTVQRGLNREDGAPESDTDHSVMVAWLGCSLAAKLYPDLDTGRIAELALAHDSIEIYAGDTYAVGLTAEGIADKSTREHAAFIRMQKELPDLTWLTERYEEYEQQQSRESRFVWAVDKLVTKVSCIFDGCAEVSKRVSMATRQEFLDKEKERFNSRVPDFPELHSLRDQLIAEAHLAQERHD